MNSTESPARLRIDFPFRLRPDLNQKAEQFAAELGLDRDYLINELLSDCFELIEDEAVSGSSAFRQKFSSLVTLKRFKQRHDAQRLL